MANKAITQVVDIMSGNEKMPRLVSILRGLERGAKVRRLNAPPRKYLPLPQISPPPPHHHQRKMKQTKGMQPTTTSPRGLLPMCANTSLGWNSGAPPGEAPPAPPTCPAHRRPGGKGFSGCSRGRRRASGLRTV